MLITMGTFRVEDEKKYNSIARYNDDGRRMGCYDKRPCGDELKITSSGAQSLALSRLTESKLYSASVLMSVFPSYSGPCIDKKRISVLSAF